MNHFTAHLTALSVAMVAASGVTAATCNPMSVNTCTLPFPSDVWAIDSAASPTGKVLQLADDVLRPELLAELPAFDGFTPSQLFNGSTGFSAASPVIFEFKQTIRTDEVIGDGASQVVAIDLTTGELLDVRVQASAYAKGENVSAPSEAVEIYPRARWPFGHEILVALTTDFPVSTYQTVAGRVAQGSDAYLSSLVQGLQSAGLNPDQVMSATRFTVRDQAEVVEPMRQIVRATWEGNHEVRNIEVDYGSYYSDDIALVTGELRTDSYRTQDGTGQLDFNRMPTSQWLKFRLTLPKASVDGPVPVALYAHGLGGDKTMDGLAVVGMNAELGVATFGIDFPNHGDRVESDGGQIFEILEINKLPSVIGMVQHNAIDFAAAHKALYSLANLDVVKRRSNWFSCWKCSDGTPDIDPTQVFMEGTSLGGVLGSAYGTLAPDLMGAVYHVTGVGITSILSNSTLWDGTFSQLMPPTATGAEALMLKGAVQQVLDYGDSINYIEEFRAPVNGQGPRPMLVITGKDDNVVPTDSSVALARILDMPIVGRVRFDMSGVETAADYDQDGYGLRQYPGLVGGLELVLGRTIVGASGHMAFLWATAQDDQQEWIKRYILNR